MTTLSVKNPRSPIRAQAPRVGIHLPIPNDRIAAQTPNQMNRSENTYWPLLPVSQKKVWNVVYAVIARTPPIQTGFESQYMTVFTQATSRPNASFVHT